MRMCDRRPVTEHFREQLQHSAALSALAQTHTDGRWANCGCAHVGHFEPCFGTMLHEILLALLGHCGDVVIETSNGFEVAPDLGFVSSADKAGLAVGRDKRAFALPTSRARLADAGDH